MSSANHSYFAAYPDFIPDPHLPLLRNFYRLAKAQAWSKKRRNKEKQIYLLGQYAIHLGGISTGGLQKWQDLCRELKVDPIPMSITQCKRALKTDVHVNIIDLIDSRRLGTEVTTFRSHEALVKYTRSSSKYFPLNRAKADELKKVLLRHIQ
ncbi:hypothetical protein MMC29_006263 [Sticta canariensis]|nr:hypothetical protein [Sticta canariensis]